MPYIIDGHNLVPHMPGLSLDDPDDEVQLIQRLQEFCRVQRKEASVYFDKAPAGQPRSQKFGLVTAYFVRSGTTADAAIQARLARMGGEARNWTIVSSDLAVQASARAARAQFISSEAFARMLILALQHRPPGEEKPGAGSLEGDELDDWLKLFGG